MNIIYPKPLKAGDTVALIGVSGCVHREDVDGYVADAKACLESLGFRVKVDESCSKRYGFLSGTDEERAAALERAFCDAEVDGVWCIKGGYGCARMVELVDWAKIAAHPKAFIGYSDITVLHIALYERCHLATFHGPMPGSGITEPCRESLLHAISGNPDRELINPDGSPLRPLRSGIAEGVLVGGNLSLLAASCGTPNQLDTKGKLLFIEEVGEFSYRVDEFLWQLEHTGMFQNCAGILLGGFTDCNEEYDHSQCFTTDEILQQMADRVNVPVLAGLQVGHMDDKLTLAFGRRYRLDADTGRVTLAE
ncbi:MAG: LD-carboxypeptidase [Clostridia bacterium]|nr:LD-carboxypeptidase [Clostridia bacterium]